MLGVHRSYHGEVDALVILKRIQKTNQPLALCAGENVALGQDMADLIQLEKKLLAHYFERTHFFCIFLLCEEDLSITSLTDLCENLEVSLSQPRPPLAQVGSLTPEILIQGFIIFSFRRARRCRVLGFEL